MKTPEFEIGDRVIIDRTLQLRGKVYQRKSDPFEVDWIYAVKLDAPVDDGSLRGWYSANELVPVDAITQLGEVADD